MAVTYSKQLYVHLSKYGKRNLFPALGNNGQNFLSVVHYSDNAEPSKAKLSKAMKAYLERSVKYDKFMREQLEEYDLGKKFLANMMGKKNEGMTQKEVDEAIDYLFPSGLFVPKSRPMMKPPEEVFDKQKEAVFDNTGRPFSFLFYTSKPNYSQCLHEAASVLESLNKKEWGPDTPPPSQLILPVGEWYSKDKLEKVFLEKLYDIEYEKFIEVFTRLSEHKFALTVENFIRKYWDCAQNKVASDTPVNITVEGGVKHIKIEGLRRKTCEGTVIVKHPGKGGFLINNLGIEYFHNIQCREQIIFPLLLTDMLGQVDVEATVVSGGEASQAGVIRLGISLALKSIVSSEMALRMKVAGLLQKDIRRKERKKPGKAGARRGYTWLKR